VSAEAASAGQSFPYAGEHGHGYESSRGRQPVTVLEAVEAIPPVGLHAVTVTSSGGRCTVSVEVRRGDDHAAAIGEGLLAVPIVRRMVADATLRAMATLEPVAQAFGIDAVTVGQVGSDMVATLTVVDGRRGGGMFAGAAVVGFAGEHDAIGRAVVESVTHRLFEA
jgi:hypothetical protein